MKQYCKLGGGLTLPYHTGKTFYRLVLRPPGGRSRLSTQGGGLSPGHAHQPGGSSPGVTVWDFSPGVNLQGGILRAPIKRLVHPLTIPEPGWICHAGGFPRLGRSSAQRTPNPDITNIRTDLTLCMRKIWAVTLYHTRLSFDRLPHIISGWIRRKILI